MRAANRILAHKWLDAPESGGRFLGSIRLAMNDTEVALRMATLAYDPDDRPTARQLAAELEPIRAR